MSKWKVVGQGIGAKTVEVEADALRVDSGCLVFTTNSWPTSLWGVNQWSTATLAPEVVDNVATD